MKAIEILQPHQRGQNLTKSDYLPVFGSPDGDSMQKPKLTNREQEEKIRTSNTHKTNSLLYELQHLVFLWD